MADRAEPPPASFRLAALVAAGGAAGTAGRHGVVRAIGETEGIPVGVVVVNLTGALLIGALVAVVAQRVAGPRRQHLARLFFGTGMLGGYTTYSAFAVGAAELVRAGRPAVALAYGLGTVVAGVAAAFTGMRLAAAGWSR